MKIGGAQLKKISSFPARPLIWVAVFVVFLIGIPLVDALATKGKIYPGVRVGPLEIGGKTTKEARALLEREFDAYRTKEQTFLLNNTPVALRLGNLLDF